MVNRVITNQWPLRAVVVAQLTVQLLPLPEDPGSNLVIGNFYWTIISCQLIVEKTKMKKKRPGTDHFFKKTHWTKSVTFLCQSTCLVSNLSLVDLTRVTTSGLGGTQQTLGWRGLRPRGQGAPPSRPKSTEIASPCWKTSVRWMTKQVKRWMKNRKICESKCLSREHSQLVEKSLYGSSPV